MSDDRSHANKQVVSELFDLIYGDGSGLDRVPDLVAEDYVQHNPLVPQGLEGFLSFFRQVVPLPGRDDPAEVRLIADGDFVVRQETRENGMLIDIFEVRDGKLSAHWDAFRPSAAKWPWF